MTSPHRPWPALALAVCCASTAAADELPRDLSGPWTTRLTTPAGELTGAVTLHQTRDDVVELRGEARTPGAALTWQGVGQLSGNVLTAPLLADTGARFTATWLLSADARRLTGVWVPSDPSAPRWREVLRLPTPAAPVPATAAGAPIGVLLASHGDIDGMDEVPDYVKTAFIKNDAVPIPGWLRPPLAGLSWELARGIVESQYERIGPTRYREASRKQADAVQAALRAQGVNAIVDYGFNFAPPFIGETLARMRAAGVRRIVMFNQGAQYSYATGGENIKDVLEYQEEHPDWDAEVIAVKEFSSDPRFRQVLAEVIQRDVQAAFPGVPPRDICILMVSHGLPLRLIEQGDPATAQMLDVVEELRGRFQGYGLRHGFLNDDFFPGAAWTTPKAIDTAYDMTLANWPCVYVDSRLSFTVHHRATLFDADVEVREMLEQADLDTLQDGSLHPLLTRTRVVLGQQFDDDPAFANLLAELTRDALAGRGDLVTVEPGMQTP